MNHLHTTIDLDRVQRWMLAVITHPDGVEAGASSPDARTQIDVPCEQIDEIVCRSQALSSIARLHVYANAYYVRLIEVMAAEFPALAKALGDELFRDFVTGYLQEFPSNSYTLAELGRRFPEFLAKSRPAREGDDDEPDWADCLVDLATLERTFGEVFDGDGVEHQRLLAREDLLSLAPEHLPSARLVVVPCLRLVRLRFPVHEFISAVRRGDSPALPPPAVTHLAVTRRDYVVRRVPVGEAEFVTLSALVAGNTVGDALAEAARVWTGSDCDLAAAVRGWFADWAAAGYFLAVEHSQAPPGRQGNSADFADDTLGGRS
jgi:hypothetical protein